MDQSYWPHNRTEVGVGLCQSCLTQSFCRDCLDCLSINKGSSVISWILAGSEVSKPVSQLWLFHLWAFDFRACRCILQNGWWQCFPRGGTRAYLRTNQQSLYSLLQGTSLELCLPELYFSLHFFKWISLDILEYEEQQICLKLPNSKPNHARNDWKGAIWLFSFTVDAGHKDVAWTVFLDRTLWCLS